MAFDSMTPPRVRLHPFVVGIAAVLVGLWASTPLPAQAQVEGVEQAAETGLPLTDARSGAIRLGLANLRLSYASTRYGQENGQFGVGLGTNRMTGDGAWLADVQYTMNLADIETMGVNAGGGFRRIHQGFLGGAPRIFGVTGWYDGFNTGYDNYFNQIGLSLESLGERWDFRVNGNLPVGNTRQAGRPVPSGQIGYYSYYLSQLTLVPIDQAVSVVDFEAACRVRAYDAWLFAGGYTVHAQGDTEAGFKAGARGYVGDDLQLQLAVTHDDFFGTDVTFGLVWFPGRTPSQGRPASTLENRLREPVLRNDYIAIRRDTTTGGAIVTDGDGQNIRVVHVDSSASGTGDGTYESPFTSLDDVYAGSQNGDIVLVHSGSTFTGQSVVLRDFQRLLGEGGNERHTVVTRQFGTINLPETSSGALAGAIPVLTNTTGTAITLGSGDTTHAAATDVSSNEVSNLSLVGGARGIASAASVGIATANINRLSIANTTGHGIELTPFVETIDETGDNRVRFSPTINRVTFTNVGTVAGDDIHLDATTSQPTTVPVTENIQITNVTSADGHGRGVNIINNKSAATIRDYSFDGGTTATGALRFSGTQAGATVSNAEITGAGTGIDIVGGSKGTFTFSSTTLTNTGGTSFNLNGGTATVNFTGRIVQGNNAATVAIGGGHATGTVTFSEAETGEGVIAATNGTGLQFNDADGTYRFNNGVVLNGGDAGIDILNGSKGNFIFSSDTKITTPSGIAFNLNGSEATVTYSGTIDHATGRAVAIESNAGGLATFSGAITATGTSTGILVNSNTGGSFQFTGLADLNTGSNTAVTISGNDTDVTTRFSNLKVVTSGATGFSASGGGIIGATGTTNTIATTGAAALNLNGMEIASTGMAFKSVSANGSGTAANGIVLDTLTGTGTLTIGSGGGSVGDGGTIENTTGDAISITNAARVSLNYMAVTNGVGGDGIHLSHTTGSFNVTVANSSISDTAGQGIDLNASATGTAYLTLTNNTVANSNGVEAVSLTANSGTMTFRAQGNTFGNNSASAAFFAQGNNLSTVNATMSGNSFSNANGRGLEIENNNSASVRLSLLDNQASSGTVPATPFLMDKNGGSFGIVLLNPQPDAESYTAPNVNQRNGGTGAYADYPTNWVIELDPGIASFTHLNTGDVPTPP